jgi:hypothetical protein
VHKFTDGFNFNYSQLAQSLCKLLMPTSSSLENVCMYIYIYEYIYIYIQKHIYILLALIGIGRGGGKGGFSCEERRYGLAHAPIRQTVCKHRACCSLVLRRGGMLYF